MIVFTMIAYDAVIYISETFVCCLSSGIFRCRRRLQCSSVYSLITSSVHLNLYLHHTFIADMTAYSRTHPPEPQRLASIRGDHVLHAPLEAC